MELSNLILCQVEDYLQSDGSISPKFFGLTTRRFRQLFTENVCVSPQGLGQENVELEHVFNVPEVCISLPRGVFSKKSAPNSPNPIADDFDHFWWVCKIAVDEDENRFCGKVYHHSLEPRCMLHDVMIQIVLQAVDKLNVNFRKSNNNEEGDDEESDN